MGVEVWRSLLVDRIHMTVGITGKELYGFGLGQLYSIKEMEKLVVPNGKIKLSSQNYVTRLHYYPVKGRQKIADLEIGCTKSKHKYFRLGLYPPEFKGDEFDHFKCMLTTLLDPFEYAKLYQTSRVSYIELAADTLTHNYVDILPFRKGGKSSAVWVDPVTNVKGTISLGTESSQLLFRIYDKNKEMLAKGQGSPYKRRTRIEARLRHVGLKPCELIQLKNPFVRLHISEVTTARALTKDPGWHSFLDRCRDAGVPVAMSEVPSLRKKYRKMLLEVVAPWWKPADQWTGLSGALAVLAP